MFKTIRQYNSYTSKKVTIAAYVLFPIAVFILLATVSFFSRKTDVFETLITTISLMVSIWACIVVCLEDRFNFGAFLSDKSRLSEMAKTSPKGVGMTKNIIFLDIFSRLFLIILSSLGIAVSGFIGNQDKKIMILLMFILFVLSSHTTTSLLVWICRMIENQTISTLIYSFGILLFLPTTVLFILPEELFPPFIYTGTIIVNLILDVIINAAGMYLLNRFIKREWYND